MTIIISRVPKPLSLKAYFRIGNSNTTTTTAPTRLWRTEFYSFGPRWLPISSEQRSLGVVASTSRVARPRTGTYVKYWVQRTLPSRRFEFCRAAVVFQLRDPTHGVLRLTFNNFSMNPKSRLVEESLNRSWIPAYSDSITEYIISSRYTGFRGILHSTENWCPPLWAEE